VLWIDDEIRSDDDAAVLLMRAEGLELEVATSALDGLERAATREYAAIILDVRLPDINGLDVLERLRDIAPTAAVMVLSGYIDVADAGRAVRLGARDVRTKPLIGEELSAAVRELLASSGRPSPILSRQPSPPRPWDCNDAHADARPSIREIVRLLGDRECSALDYLVLANELRQRVAACRPAKHRQLPRRRGPVVSNETHTAVKAILLGIERDLAAGRIPRIEAIARQMDMTPRQITLLLEDALQLTFRECRRALRLRPAVHWVACTPDQYAQIAYRIGYEHPTQFTRDFKRALTLSPHELRALGGAR
jgi:DNA-binding response OmpR family regulator